MLGKTRAHTAGIFSDMSIDGPEIGTLVIVVDRAKNLPNRKTIGKQDPYCAARLGKEAKKTSTDIRGGQTPRWDQELRFVVHDSPDYYQLKVSVFNDDKRTDLIGDAWIDLKPIIIAGGGQADIWQSLNCRGKYAGDIRIEITFYDSRPKPEVAHNNPVQRLAEAEGGMKTQPASLRRRPLPFDPIAGETGSPALADQHRTSAPTKVSVKTATSHIPTQSPLQSVEYNNSTTSTRRTTQDGESRTSIPVRETDYSTPPAQRQVQAVHYDYHTPPLQLPTEYPSQAPENQAPTTQTPSVPMAHRHSQPTDYETHPLSRHGHVLGDYSPAPQQLPTQPVFHSVEYDVSPIQSRSQPAEYQRAPTKSYSQPVPYPHASMDRSPVSAPSIVPVRTEPAYRSPAQPYGHQSHQYEGPEYSPSHGPSYSCSHSPSYGPSPSSQYSGHTSSRFAARYHGEAPRREATVGRDLPPPPPAHQIAPGHDSGSSQDMTRLSLEPAQQRGEPPSRYDGLRNEVQRYSMPPQSFRPALREHDSAPVTYSANVHHPGHSALSHPRPHSFDSGSGQQTRSLQPTVEDLPESPLSFSHSPSAVQSSRSLVHQDRATYRPSMAPAPLRLSGRGSVSPGPGQYTPSARSDHGVQHPSPLGHGTAPPYDPYRNYSLSQNHQGSVSSISYHEAPHGLPPALPSSLVASMDPLIAQEMSDRIYEETRGDRRQSDRQSRYSTPVRGWPVQAGPGTHFRSSDSPLAIQSGPYDGQGSERDYHSYAMVQARPRGSSPNPGQHLAVRHKPSHSGSYSIPEARHPSESPLGDVPFAPDSYNSLNPSASSAEICAMLDAKIITHDGREVDPSDHLPIESWAPEPEPRKPTISTSASNSVGNNPAARLSPGRVQPMSLSVRGAVRVAPAARPQSIPFHPSPPRVAEYRTPVSGPPPPLPPAPGSGGRNRLQKRPPRLSTSGAPSPTTSSPLAPLPSINYQDSHVMTVSGRTPLQAMPRTIPMGDYPSENTAPMYGNSPGGGSGGGGASRASLGGSGALMLAKVPVQAPQAGYDYAAVGPSRGRADDRTLVEEISRIDLGQGRSRRHNGGDYY